MKYKVGDKVIIREWDDMEREFGLDFGGDIKAKCCFVRPMRKYCGKKMTIGGIAGEGNYTMVNGDGWIFSADTFEKNNNQKIVVTTDGTETLARLYEGDKVVKKATAKRSPDDTFDFNVGAKLAFERLMNEQKWRVVNRDPKVGDYVRIKHNDYPDVADVGDILKVDKVYHHTVSVCNNNMPRPSKNSGDTFHWNYYFREIEVVEPVNGAVEEKPKEKKEEYYNGKVVCVESGFGCSFPLPDITVGKVYTVTDGILVLNDNYKSHKYKTLDDICKGLGHKFIPFVE